MPSSRRSRWSSATGKRLGGPPLSATGMFWIALAIGGLFFLYNALWAI